MALAAFIVRNYFQYRDEVNAQRPSVLGPFDVTTRMIAIKTMKVPHPHEVAACCAKVSGVIAVRSPQCFMWREHCRSMVHVAALFGIPVAALRRAVCAWKKLAEAESILKTMAS